MKGLSIKHPISIIGARIRNTRLERHQAKLNELVSIEHGRNKDAYNKIFDAQEILANYAKAKNVRININDAANSEGKLINIEVKKDNITLGEFVSSDTSRIVTAERDNKRFLENKDGLNYFSDGKFTSEDTFLKNIYRVVENLTKVLYSFNVSGSIKK